MHMKPWFLVSGTHMCGISYEDSKILSSTLKDSQRTITSVQISFKEKSTNLDLKPQHIQPLEIKQTLHTPTKPRLLGFLVLTGAEFPKQTQNPFKLRKRFTSGALVQGNRANTDPNHNTFKGSNWVRTTVCAINHKPFPQLFCYSPV